LINNFRRFFIEKYKLVYYPKLKRWYAASSCIWAPDEIQVPHKICLASQYKQQRSFFHKVLEIEEPSVTMHITALQSRALEPKPNKDSILREVKNICALSPSTDLLNKELSDCKFLPVRRPDGGIEWLDRTGAFAIVDRREYADVLENQINILDLSLDEVHSIDFVLRGLGLEERYMSRAIEEETSVQAGLPDEPLTKDLRRKASAICR
jgi:hypothetical protein